MFATNQVGSIENDDKLIEKFGKLSKSGNLKGKKLSKSQKSTKSRKNHQNVGIYLISTLKKINQVS